MKIRWDMKKIFTNPIAAIIAAGLMILAFMDLKIGLDLGRVMAKGVLLSLLCAMTLLPILILLTDKLIEKTRKKPFEPKMSALSNFNYKHRKKMALVFLGIFALSFYLNIKTEISFEQPSDNFSKSSRTPRNSRSTAASFTVQRPWYW